MGTRTSTLVAKLKDDVTGPSQGINRSLRSILRTATSVRSVGLGNLMAPIGRAGSAFQGAGLAAFGFAGGAAAAGVAVRAAVTDFAQLDRHLRRVAITGDATEEEAKAAATAIRALAQMPGSPGLDNIVQGLDALVAAGRTLPEAMRFLPSVVVTAQAAGAETAEIATTADALGANFAIAADKMQSAFDILVAGGKLGKFELKDMARYLPSLAGAAAPVVGKGEEGLRNLVAIAQAVRAGTGTAEEAAASLMNIFSKMESDQTAKSFSEFGIDLRKEMAKARKEGKDLLEVFIDLSSRALKGDLSKLPQLFSDQEFARGMRALVGAPDALKKMKAALGNVDGTALRDFGRIANDAQDKIEQFTNAWREMTLLLGAGAAPLATDLLERIRLQFREIQSDFAAFDAWIKQKTGMGISEMLESANKAVGGETNEEMRARLDRQDAERRDPTFARRNAAARAEEEARAKVERAQRDLDVAKGSGTSKLAEAALAERRARAQAEYEKARKAREDADGAMPFLQQGLDVVGILPQPAAPQPKPNPNRTSHAGNEAFAPPPPSMVPPVATYEAAAAHEQQQRAADERDRRIGEAEARIEKRSAEIRAERDRLRADAQGRGGAALRRFNNSLADQAEERLTTDPEIRAAREEIDRQRGFAPPPPVYTPSPAQAAFAEENDRRRAAAGEPPGARGGKPSAGDISSPEAMGRQMADYLGVPSPQVDLSQVRAAEEEARRAGQGMNEALSIMAAPQVDASSIGQALDLARELNRELARTGTLAAQAEAAGRRRADEGWNHRGSHMDVE